MNSSKVQEIERAIGALAPHELEELYVWLEERYLSPIDTRVQSDLDAGRLDIAIGRALFDETDGHTRAL